jgi:DNA repair photolyase
MVFKFEGAIQGGAESELCSYPVGLDPYRAGCGNDCLYCYVRHANLDRGGWRPEAPNMLDTDHLAKIFKDAIIKGKANSNAKRLLISRLPLRIGMNTDPFQNLEREKRVTYRTLEILKEYKYPYVLLTKNRLAAAPEYVEIYDDEISYLEVTITSLNERMSGLIETNASLPKDRLEAVKEISAAGIKTAVRINPLFPIYPDGYFTSGYKPPTDLRELEMFSWDLVHEVCKCKPTTVIAGFLRLDSVKTRRWIKGKTGLDLGSYFWKHGSQKYYSPEEVRYYYEKCKGICDEYGIPFSVCFDCNANYNYFKYLWANPEDCCNAFNQTPSLNKTFRMIKAGEVWK